MQSISKIVATIYIAAVLALAGAAVFIWRLKCESFGCMGVGVAWFAWVVVFVPVMVVGVALRSRVSLGVRLLQATRAAVWLQAATGAVLLAAWVGKSAA
jgi:hypothetical protein